MTFWPTTLVRYVWPIEMTLATTASPIMIPMSQPRSRRFGSPPPLGKSARSKTSFVRTGVATPRPAEARMPIVMSATCLR
jgi:hypothetical protein